MGILPDLSVALIYIFLGRGIIVGFCHDIHHSFHSFVRSIKSMLGDGNCPFCFPCSHALPTTSSKLWSERNAQKETEQMIIRANEEEAGDTLI